ncbi:MAG: hypothetical protein B6I22_10090 [Desulfobacteraceae bacterium 4572_123]|nr:MAG: hypothetical protein B6I22_10090 [Desulfobacteraceae bacterium 4572_123]
MEQLDHISQIIALSMGAAWASGINLYAAILVLGLLGGSGNMALPPDLHILTNPIVLGAAGIMYLVEFFADKVPAVDTSWDTVHTFIRIPAGALLAAGAVGDINPALALAAGIVGGGIAAGTHATKSGTRVLINTSPEPFSNWAVSIGEDVAVIAGLWVALQHPLLFILLLICFVLLMIWLLPRLWRGIKKVFRSIAGLFGRKEPKVVMEPDTGLKPEITQLIQDSTKTE